MSDKKQNFKILAVDDNLNSLEIIKRILDAKGYVVITCSSVNTAVEILNDQKIDVVITDFKMPQRSGLELSRYINENCGDIGIIMVTGYPSIDGAVKAIKTGVEEFLPKPFTNEELSYAVQNVVEKLKLQRSAQTGERPETTCGMIGDSETMQHVFRMISKASALTANILISGESGTGKELVARAIHYDSSRSSAPFVPVNCTAIPESLLESELFGHVKGAYTGANVSRKGFFQIADGGTIFLDEIGDASQNLQAKLLRVMQNKEITKVGSGEVVKVDTRIIAATHKDLLSLVGRGLFREDLFYRLNIIDIPIPPLRERGEDLPLLIHYFINNFCREMGRKPVTFSDRALNALINHPWPGNVRELENLVHKLVAITDNDTLDISDLPAQMRFNIGVETGLDRSLAQVEAEYITRVLSGVDGNKTQAAKILKIDRKTLREKLKKIEPGH